MDDHCSSWFSPLINNVGLIVLSILVAIDQVVQTLLVAPFAILGLASIPDPDETISGILGRRSESQTWALVLSLPIDAIFLILTLGVERNHCQWAAEREKRRKIEQELTSFMFDK